MKMFRRNNDSKRDVQIGRQQQRDSVRVGEVAKLLLLGTGESGKSAFFKQTRILFGKQYSPEELQRWRPTVHSNVVEACQELCVGVEALGLGDQLRCPEDFEEVRQMPMDSPIGTPLKGSAKSLGEAVKGLWQDPAVQKAWDHRSQLQVLEPHGRFLNDMDRLFAGTYSPTLEDVVLARVRSSGIASEEFSLDKHHFALFDVGGQKNERRKWIHAFDNVQSVIFVVGLSEYDQPCFEDASKNRMVEALEVFRWIANHELFLHIPIVLFLNKRDLFAEKLQRSPVHEVEHFSDCPEGADFEVALAYFRDKFVDILRKVSPNKPLTTFVTCATDRDDVRAVLTECAKLAVEAKP